MSLLIVASSEGGEYDGRYDDEDDGVGWVSPEITSSASSPHSNSPAEKASTGERDIAKVSGEGGRKSGHNSEQ